ncbi:putative secreted RxLR effector protein [Phytophthora cinnamomi]|uniref:putative secreted RxLR effector protein n=1 Tax=Phytophthora cinnamomi TaxID=4785 RepID=UPI003559FC18|nr:putative secreted RxLR effector protein [Phytophthora cinnamomi]
MRVEYVVLVVAATLSASFDASAATGLTLSQVAAPGRVQSVLADERPIKRFLRVAVAVEEDEERVLEKFTHLLPLNKVTILGKDGLTFSNKFIKKMLNKESFRTKYLTEWAQTGDIDGVAFKVMLGDMSKKGRVELLNRYTAALGSPNGIVMHNAGPIV